MRKLFTIMLSILLLVGCTHQNGGTQSNNTTTTPVTTTNYNVTYIEGDIVFGDILPKDIQEIVLEYNNMTLHFKNDEVQQEFLDYIKDIPLYSEYEEGMHGAGAPFGHITIIDSNGDEHSYWENWEDTLEVNAMENGIKKSKTYGYYKAGEDALSEEKHYLTKYFLEIYEPYKQPYSTVERWSNDHLTVLHAETKDYIIDSELGHEWVFIYGYDNLMNMFDFDAKALGLTIYENDIQYEELPSNVGEHVVILKKGDVSYQMKYIVHEEAIKD